MKLKIEKKKFSTHTQEKKRVVSLFFFFNDIIFLVWDDKNNYAIERKKKLYISIARYDLKRNRKKIKKKSYIGTNLNHTLVKYINNKNIFAMRINFFFQILNKKE